MEEYRQSTNQLIKILIENETLNEVFVEMLGKVVIVAIIIAAILYLISLGVNVFKNGIKTISGDNDGQFIDYNDLFRTISIIFLICIYRLLVPAFLGGVNFINSITALPQERKDNLAEYAENYNKTGDILEDNMETIMYVDAYFYSENKDTKDAAAKKLQNILGDDWEQKAQSIKTGDIGEAMDNIVENESRGFIAKGKEALIRIWEGIKRLPMDLISGIVSFFGNIVRKLIFVLAAIFLRILLIVGPLALAFSIIFRQQAELWLSAVLSLAFVHTTINILDTLAFGLYSAYDNIENLNYNLDYNTITAIETMKIGLLVAYFMTFWLTSKFVGKGDAGRIMSKAVGLATLAVASVAAVGGGALGKAGSAVKSQAGNTAKGVKDAFQDEG